MILPRRNRSGQCQVNAVCLLQGRHVQAGQALTEVPMMGENIADPGSNPRLETQLPDKGEFAAASFAAAAIRVGKVNDRFLDMRFEGRP